jgi:hypothetical protein
LGLTMFYVYEHIRADTGAVFYVGKGKGYRHKSKCDRNRYWNHIVAKAGGFDAQIIVSHKDNDLILLCEQERIDQLKRLGVKLCNLTAGGEGMAGFSFSEETKRKISEKAKARPKRKLSSEHKEAIRKSNTGVKFTEERKRKIGEKAKGRKMPDHLRQKLAEIKANYKHSPETIAKMCELQRARPKKKCLYCNFVGNVGNLKRWHDENCKMKGIKDE